MRYIIYVKYIWIRMNHLCVLHFVQDLRLTEASVVILPTFIMGTESFVLSGSM